MKLSERISEIAKCFSKLMQTTSRNEKQWILELCRRKDFQLARDLDYALEILDGRHKLGYTFLIVERTTNYDGNVDETQSLEQYLAPLYIPKETNRFDEATLKIAISHITLYPKFVASLVNRRFRLGIGASQLEKSDITPMLGKKLEWGKIPSSRKDYFVTEKLDGNRCIAKYDVTTAQWTFWSRSGKRLRVNFNMEGLPTSHKFDGEIVSLRQLSSDRGQAAFNELSGAINSKFGDKTQLAYRLFDILSMPEDNYWHRRRALDFFGTNLRSSNVQVLPVIATYSCREDLEEHIPEHLQSVVSSGGEGLMINIGDRLYEHKRTDGLLKVKETYTMDMEVIDLFEGTGKNEGAVGALLCRSKDAQGNVYECRVGSGLSDYQRVHFFNYPFEIIGRVVEVAYFSVSQDAAARGSKVFALRFPRLKGIRKDKDTTSID